MRAEPEAAQPEAVQPETAGLSLPDAGAEPGPRDRQPRARRNDERVLAAAREIFMEHGPGAPVSQIAAQAGVGIATLYRRYPSKNDLLREVCADSLRRTIAAAEAALRVPDAWDAFGGFLAECLELRVTGLNHLSGTFRVTDEVRLLADRSRELIQAVADRAHADGPLRPGITAADITKLLQQLRTPFSAQPGRAAQLARRYLAVVLAGLRGTAPLPEPPADWQEDAAQWEVQRGQPDW
jgi:AcrR family transcriptional regulator